MENGPIFVLGAPRTGTTLLRLILNSHPNITIPEELHFFRSKMFGSPIEEWARTISFCQEAHDELKDMMQFMASDTGMVFLSDIGSHLSDQGQFSLGGLFKLIGKMVLERSGKTRWGEKTPENILYTDVLFGMLPEAKYLIIERDPRAVIASMNDVYFYSSDTQTNLLNLKYYYEHGYALARKVLPPSSYLEVSYEDLVDKPNIIVSNICSFLGEEFYPSMLEFYKSSRNHMSRNASDIYNRDACSPINHALSVSWKSELPKIEQNLISHVFGLVDDPFSIHNPDFTSALDSYNTFKQAWELARSRHTCSREFQMRRAGQSSNSNISNPRWGP